MVFFFGYYCSCLPHAVILQKIAVLFYKNLMDWKDMSVETYNSLYIQGYN